MTVLADSEIKELLRKGTLVIEPIEDMNVQLQPASVDLRLGDEFRIFKQRESFLIDPLNYVEPLWSVKDKQDKDLNKKKSDSDSSAVQSDKGSQRVKDYGITEIIKIKDKPFIVHPQEFVLGTTIEKVKIPANLVGRLEGRSSLGRIGVIIHATAGYIDPGFEGQVTLEITNLGKVPVALWPGMRVCQLSLFTMNVPAERPYGASRNSKYNGQKGPVESRISSDSGITKLKKDQSRMSDF
ncbi:MAG: dCTP deaminase [Candidatus Diapherotrites archaeon]|nr:dCTP deaminase [Candidatus Diapherotrites archaeon]